MNLTRRSFLISGASTGLLLGLSPLLTPVARAAQAGATEKYEVMHTDAEWRSLLSPSAYNVLRQEGTELPYSSALNSEHRTGIFACIACSQQLYSSKTKFDSHTGWPSFWQPLDNAVKTREDNALGMTRTEVHCKRCGGHLGHVFDDGPKPTGLRYCMNGVAMKFLPGAA
jgi:peptide-methionine (R)-S-oxide reductase